MVQIKFEYSGELRCQATHGPSQAQVITDAPVDNHGRGESFSPTDLVATALGACMLTIMGIVADKRGWDITGAKATVEKGMQQSPVRRIASLGVKLSLPAAIEPDARRVLETAAKNCPVWHSLNPDIELPVSFVWHE
jgi:putative redox protein